MAGEQQNADAGKTGEGDGGKDDGFKPVTYSTQADLDAAFADRATRAANSAKAEALKALTDAGVSVEDALEAYNTQKAAEDAKKDPAVKEREKAQKDRAELQRYKDKEARDKLSIEVAKDLKIKVGDVEHPIPAQLLAGTTKDEMVSHGESIIEFFSTLGVQQAGQRAPAYNPFQGQSVEDKVTTGDPLRNFFDTGSFI